MENIISVNNLSFFYPKATHPALENINLEIKKGELIAIAGASGSGKTTLCNALVGLIPHYFTGETIGEVLIKGHKVSEVELAELSKYVGLVFQDPFNQLSYACNTVEEELAYGLENRGICREEMIKRIDYVAKLVHIKDLLKRFPLSLSGGQVQRVAFGCALVLKPEVLVLDECTSQLDPQAANIIFEIIQELNKQGITVIMSDNNIENVSKYADRVILLNKGKQITIDTPKRVFEMPNIFEYGVAPPEYSMLTQKMVRMNLISKTHMYLNSTAEEIRWSLHHGS